MQSLIHGLPLALTVLVPCFLAGAAEPEDFLSLDEAVQAAVANNFGYRIAAIDPEIALQSVIRAESAFDTEIFASGVISQQDEAESSGREVDNRNLQAGVRKRFGYGTTVTAQTNLNRIASDADFVNDDGFITSNDLSQEADVSLTIRQPLLSGFGPDVNRAGIRSAVAGVSASREGFRDSLYGLLAVTEETYWSVARYQEQLELNESSLDVAEALLEEAREREQVGVATRIEVLQAEASRAERLEVIIRTRRLLGDSMDGLFRSMGILPPDPELGPVTKVRDLPSGSNAIPVFADSWQLALAADPDLARQEAVISQRDWDRLAAKSGVKPNLDLLLSGAYLGKDEADASEAYDSAFDRDGHAWSVSLEFSMPWRMRGEKASLRTAEKRLEQENLRYEDLKRALYQEVRSAWRDLETVSQSVEAATLTVELQEATFDREKSKYEEGLSAFRDVLEAQRDLDFAKIRLLDAKYERLIAEITLSRLTGRIEERHGLAPQSLSTD